MVFIDEEEKRLGLGGWKDHPIIPEPVVNPSINKLPGLSYVPDKIEVAEDKELMDKVAFELYDFITTVNQFLDMMHLVKTKHLRTTTPLPHPVIREMVKRRGRGPLYRAFDRKLRETNPSASPSVEMIIKAQTFLQPPRRPRGSKIETGAKSFPFANDLVSITGRKTRPLWQSVVLEKPEETNVLKKVQPKIEVKSDSDEDLYIICKRNPGLTRSKSETTVFSIKFSQSHNKEPLARPDPVLARQMEMMLASHAGFRTVEEHKAYLSTQQSHWYTNFVQEAMKLGIVNCPAVITALESLARYYDMKYNSLPFAKAKLCLIIMSLPFWDVVRVVTQRAVEFIMEEILLLPGKPLMDWLRVLTVPYVVFPTYTAEDFIIQSESDVAVEEENGEVEEKAEEKKPEKFSMSTSSGVSSTASTLN